jgi:hypothetical protein
VRVSVKVLELVRTPLKGNVASRGKQCVTALTDEALGLTICTEFIVVHPGRAMFVLKKLVIVVVVVIIVGTSNDQLAKNVGSL